MPALVKGLIEDIRRREGRAGRVSFSIKRRHDPFGDRAERRRQDDAVQPDHRRLHADARARSSSTGDNVAGISPDELARRGMSRTFQNLQVCMNMSAIDNVMVGAHLRLNQSAVRRHAAPACLRRADAACRDEAAQLMEFVGVGKYVAAHASQMSYGALKRLEIARALAAKPQMLLLDEPAAGLNHTETGEIEALIRRVADSGVTVVLVEHDMKLVMNLSDHILVLDYGKKLAEGTAAQVRANPDVIAAYLGASA